MSDFIQIKTGKASESNATSSYVPVSAQQLANRNVETQQATEQRKRRQRATSKTTKASIQQASKPRRRLVSKRRFDAIVWRLRILVQRFAQPRQAKAERGDKGQEIADF